jgi:DNA-binding Lrp family transcriptional regulator
VDILGKNRLAARRRECLASLDAAAASRGGPVHYSAVAERLRISPWTAYDRLRVLEREGLVTAVHMHRPEASVGRAQVAFAPTDAGRALLGPRHEAPEERALARARRHLGVNATTLGTDLAAHLGFWLGQAEQLSTRSQAGLRQLLRSAPEAATALTTFVGAVYGAVAPQRAGEADDDLLAAVTAFQHRLARTTAARRERLAHALATLLEARPAGSARPAPDGA